MVLNAYTLAYAAFLIPAGRLADSFGHKRTFIIGSGLFTIGSLLCAVAPSVPMLIAAPAVQAIGGAALVPASLALVLAATPRARMPQTIAIWGSIGAWLQEWASPSGR